MRLHVDNFEAMLFTIERRNLDRVTNLNTSFDVLALYGNVVRGRNLRATGE
jgi:hypothetical protein